MTNTHKASFGNGKLSGYRIITAGTVPMLELEVTRMLRDGWEPIGGVTVEDISNGNCRIYSQAAVRREVE